MSLATQPSKPAEQPARLSYLDLSAKILLPIAILAATFLFNSSQARLQATRQDRASCLDGQFKFVGLPKDADPQQSDSLWKLIKETCLSAGLKPLRGTVEQLAATTTDVGTFGQAQKTLGVPLPTTTAASTASAPAPVVDPNPTAGLNPRVYIQIQREDQRPAAEALRATLQASTFQGRKLVAPGIELPANPKARVAQTELRCAGRDCQQAPLLAAYIASQLGRPSIPVRDISALYHGNGGAARPGHYELWIGPEELAATPRSAAPA